MAEQKQSKSEQDKRESAEPVGAAANGVAWATVDKGGGSAAPETNGTLQGTQAAALAAGYFGQRRNNHADQDYTLPGLGGGVGDGARPGVSPGDWDNQYDAPGGIDWGAGSYDGPPAAGQHPGD